MSEAVTLARRITTSFAKRALFGGAIAALLAVLTVLLVSKAGEAAGARHVRQLMPGALIALTVLGVVIGTGVWTLIVRRAQDPARLLARLVPGVLILSLAPDLALGVNGTPWGSVATLMVAHAGVFAVTIPTLWATVSPNAGVHLNGSATAHA